MKIDFFGDGREWDVQTMSVKFGAIAWKAFKQAENITDENLFETVCEAVDDMLINESAEAREEFKKRLRCSDIMRFVTLGFGMAPSEEK